MTLPAEATAERVAAGAEEEGLVLSSGAAFYADGTRFLRLPFCALSEEQIREATARLARAVRRAGSPVHLEV